ncbi:MAG: hypothetical protein K6G63_08610 [Eubacterium sp.]|nr:hypothetical protein [Eubacterium sp.]
MKKESKKILSLLVAMVLLITSVVIPKAPTINATDIDMEEIKILGPTEWKDGEKFAPTFTASAKEYNKFDVSYALTDGDKNQLFNSNADPLANAVTLDKSKEYGVYIWIYTDTDNDEWLGTIGKTKLAGESVSSHKINDGNALEIYQKLKFVDHIDRFTYDFVEDLSIGDVVITGPDQWDLGKGFDPDDFKCSSSKINDLDWDYAVYEFVDDNNTKLVYHTNTEKDDILESSKNFVFEKNKKYEVQLMATIPETDEGYYWFLWDDETNVYYNGKKADWSIIDDSGTFAVSKIVRYTEATGKISEEAESLDVGVVSFNAKTEYAENDVVTDNITATSTEGYLLVPSFRIYDGEDIVYDSEEPQSGIKLQKGSTYKLVLYANIKFDETTDDFHWFGDVSSVLVNGKNKDFTLIGDSSVLRVDDIPFTVTAGSSVETLPPTVTEPPVSSPDPTVAPVRTEAPIETEAPIGTKSPVSTPKPSVAPSVTDAPSASATPVVTAVPVTNPPTKYLAPDSSVKKGTQTITVSAKKKIKVKAKSLKKKNQRIKKRKWLKVSRTSGKLTYKIIGKKNKKISINKNGDIILKKRLKKGKYNLKIKLTAAETDKLTSASVSFKVKLVVK